MSEKNVKPKKKAQSKAPTKNKKVAVSKKKIDLTAPENRDNLDTVFKMIGKQADKEENSETSDSTTNQSIINKYREREKFLKDHGISISTITITCKLGCLIDVNMFAKYVVLRENGIVSVKYGNRKDNATNRTIVVIKSKKKPSKRAFYNQVTILMKPQNNPLRNYINIKVFKNGSLQMTGCKDMNDFYNVTNTLIKILKDGQKVKLKNLGMKHYKFALEPEKMGIFDISIKMINSNFKIDYQIDRKRLFECLRKHHGEKTKDVEIGHVECKYSPRGGHSCVNIKYKYNEVNKPSIFVFHTGSIIITGARHLHQIIKAYEFIQIILDKYYEEIKIVKIEDDDIAKATAEFNKLKKSQKKNSNHLHL